MFKLIYNAIIIVVFCTKSYAQDSIVLKGRFIGNTKYAKVIMKKFGVGNYIVGGANIKHDSFRFNFPLDIAPGVYRFQYAMAEGEQFVDIIINGKDRKIEFKMKANDASALPQFISSDENKNWYSYIEESNIKLDRINILNQFINVYTNSSADVVSCAEKELVYEKENYLKKLKDFERKMYGTWAYEMVINRPFFFTNPKEDLRIQDYYKREHFWDGFDANNPKLINTPLYTEHILNYLRYWMNPNMNFSPEEKTNGFKRSVDVIIRKFSGNNETHVFAFNYLILGFKEIAEEEVLQYLDENYKDLASQCFDDFEMSEFEKRIVGYSTIKVGNIAPDFDMNINGGIKLTLDNFTNLHSLKSSQILIVFWSSSCPLCMEELPKINELSNSKNELTIIAVSLDLNQKTNEESVKKFPNMIHTCDFKGWETLAAKKYFIAATPTFIILDNNKKIVAKFNNLSQVKNFLNN